MNKIKEIALWLAIGIFSAIVGPGSIALIGHAVTGFERWGDYSRRKTATVKLQFDINAVNFAK